MTAPGTTPPGSREPGGVRGVRRVFTTRAGGFSRPPFDSFNLAGHVGDDPAAVHANRNRLAGELGLDPADFVWMEQIHSPNVTVVRGRVPGPVEATDALVTDVPGLALVTLVADCVPLLLADDAAGVIAAVHAGRMGARAGIALRTLAAMESLGAEVPRIHALLGPAASGSRYEVPDHMAADVEARLPGSRTRTSAGTSGLDIRAGLARQLAEAGVGGIDTDPRCTIGDPALFSYRREGTTGRIAGVIWREGG